MHLHTYRSFDSLNRPEAILEAAARRGLDRIVVTDHNEIEGAFELRELDPERVIVGEEVKSAEGVDIIGIFLTERIPARTPARRTCEWIREQGGIVYLPHPFDGTRAASAELLEALADLIDVVEVHNARCWPRTLNDRAREWAVAKGKLAGAGSDAHTIREIGRGFVEVPPFTPTRESFLEALAAGGPGACTSTSPLYRLASNWSKIRKRLPGGRPPPYTPRRPSTPDTIR